MDLKSLVGTMVGLWWDTERPFVGPLGRRRSPDFVIIQRNYYLEMKLEVEYTTPAKYFIEIWMHPRPCTRPSDRTLELDCQLKTGDDKTKSFFQRESIRTNCNQPERIFRQEMGSEERTPSLTVEKWSVFCMFREATTTEPLSIQAGNKTACLSLSSEHPPVTTVDESVQASSEIPHDMEALSSDISGLLEEGILPDFRLTCGDRTFQVHRCVLAARSEVFRRMFQNRMRESESGSADIEDLDAPVLESMLEFFYSGRLGGLSEDDVSRLYEASDKYDVRSLRKACSYWLVRNLTEDNCVGYLGIAESHSDTDLEDGIVSFILEHPGVFKSADWLTFSEKLPEVANKALQAYISSVIP